MKRGREFEDLVKSRAEVYEKKRLLVLRKVDPPTRIIGKGRMIYLPNPFLDYVGSWTEQGGRSIFLEAKESESTRLGIGSSASSGVTVKQLHSLRVWRASGAIAAVLWKTIGGIYLIPIETIEVITARTRMKHVKVTELPRFCHCGEGMNLRLLTTLRAIYGVPRVTPAHPV